MKKFFNPRLACAAIVAAFVLTAGCAVHDHGSPYHSYHYYPDVEVYYDHHRHVYYWHDHGTWVSGHAPPSSIVIRPEARVDIRLRATEPWREHHRVRAKYHGKGRR